MLKHTHTVHMSCNNNQPYETYEVYVCAYCQAQTRYLGAHTCTTLSLANPPPTQMIESILDNYNDHPARRAGKPQVRYWATPPYCEGVSEIHKHTEALAKLAVAVRTYAIWAAYPDRFPVSQEIALDRLKQAANEYANFKGEHQEKEANN